MTTANALAAARNRYTGNAVTTASGPTLLVMLYDRLVRDLVQAEQALRARHLARANDELQHAQQIIQELHVSLDVDAWSGGPGLAQLYVFVREQLIEANLRKDATRVATCRELLEPLRDAWRTACSQQAGA